MRKKRAAESSPKALSCHSLFGPPPLLKGEDTSAYEELLARVCNDVNPSDVIEEIWVRDIVDLTIEIHRWRRLRTTLLEAAVSDARDEAVNSDVDNELDRLAQKHWELHQQGPEKQKYAMFQQQIRQEIKRRELSAQREPEPEPEPEPELSRYDWKEKLKQNPVVNRKLRKVRSSAESNLDMKVLTARVFVEQLEYIERIDQLTTIAEARRDKILHEIDRHRATLAQALRDNIREVEDADFKIIEPKKVIARHRPTKNVDDHRTN